MEKVELAASWDADFLNRVGQRYHYADADREALAAVAERMRAAMEGQAAFWCGEPLDIADIAPGLKAPCVAVIFTLGPGLDALQDAYAMQGRLTECYMAEVMSSQWMLEHYRLVNSWIRERTGLAVERYRFFGAEEALPLSGMGELLAQSGQAVVRANRAWLLQPKKSVVFYAQLTAAEGVSCEGVCCGCGNAACPNRTEERADRESRWPDLAGRPLSYGYARILGRGQGR